MGSSLSDLSLPAVPLAAKELNKQVVCLQVSKRPPQRPVGSVLREMSDPTAPPISWEPAEALRQLEHLQARRGLPLSLLQLLPGNLWSIEVVQELEQRRLLLKQTPVGWGPLPLVSMCVQWPPKLEL